MAFVVTDHCNKCKETHCAKVCPVDAFHEGPEFVIIDPEICIDCSLCAQECPNQAIYQADDLPEALRHFEEINAELAPLCPEIIPVDNID